MKTQVGFDVILLDSKLFPLTDNNSATGVDFWRSTRKVIAVSCASYEKLVGVVSGEELSQEADDVINLELPCKKVKKSDNITLSDVNKNINKNWILSESVFHLLIICLRMHHMQVYGSLSNCVLLLSTHCCLSNMCDNTERTVPVVLYALFLDA